MKLDKTDLRIIEEIHLLTGVDVTNVQDAFLGMILAYLLHHKEDESLRIPLFGDIRAEWLRDKQTARGVETEITVKLKPHKELRRLIGQLHDEEEAGVHNRNDVYRMLMSQIKNSLRETVGAYEG